MIPPWLRLLLLLPVACLAGSSDRHRALPQDAYVWQRHWTPALSAALAQSADLVRAWRVLAAQSDERGHLRPVSIDRAALAASGRPVIPVIRIDGQLAQWNEAVLLEETSGLLAAWRQGPMPIAGIEIDHDCGTARLAAYGRFLARLRAALDAALPLSITALPAWLPSPDLDAVLEATDEAVLQVHAVQNPRAGLFDPDLALHWAAHMGRRTTKPFRVALPAYGSRVAWRPDGRLLAVESEAPLLAGGRDAAELIAPPDEVAALRQRLERDPPAHLAGIAWFRLPTEEDRRAWSLATWRAVLRGDPRSSQFGPAIIEAQARPSDTPGMSTLRLINSGDVDAALPRHVALPEACTLADGINGYVLAQTDSGPVLERLRDGLLRGHRQQAIGWMRCAPAEAALHVEP